MFSLHHGQRSSNVRGSVPTLLSGVSCSKQITAGDLMDSDANSQPRTSCARIEFQPFVWPPFCESLVSRFATP